MYFIDREKIEAILKYLEKQIELFSKLTSIQDPFQAKALERIVQMLIETLTDVGNAMIDGFIMRDPGSYDDIIDILLDEQVITSEMADSFKKVLPLRKELVQNYTELNHENMYELVKAELDAYAQFPNRVRNYLENELGPVSAFKK